MQLGLSLGLSARQRGFGYAVAGFDPALVFDFTREYYRTGGVVDTFSGAMTFTRASNATYVDSTGTIQTASTNVARRGHHVYEGGQWVNKGLLIESEARTNQFTYSTTFTASSWDLQTLAGVQPIGSGSSANQITGPDGNTSGNFIAEYTSVGTHYAYILPIVTDGGTKTYSVFMKAGTRTKARLQIGVSALSTGVYADFDLSAGTKGNATLVSGSYTAIASYIQDFGGGWYRCSVTATCPATNHVGYVVLRDSGGATNYTGDGTSGLYVYGPQLEAGSTPSSYIPTSGATATRAAETLTVPAAKLPYSATAMSGASVLAINYADTGTATEQTLFDWRADANNRITITLDTAGANTGKITLSCVKAGVTTSVTTTNQLTPGLNVAGRIAWRVTASQINIALNGTAATAVTNAAGVPVLSAANATLSGMLSRGENRAWSEDIGDAGMAEVTA